MTINSTSWNGEYVIEVHDAGKETVIISLHNTIHSAGRTMLRNVLSGTVTDGQLKYLALGSSNASISVGDTTLGAETFRKAITSQSNFSAFELLSSTTILDTEANGQIEEIGIFAGSTASATANTGIMVSRILYSKLKTSSESLQIKRYDNITDSTATL